MLTANLNTLSPAQELESALRNWVMPSLPSTISSYQHLALRTAWGTLRRSCLLYLWRSCGFHSNVLDPIREDRRLEAQVYVDDIVADIKVILQLCKTERLSIGTSLMWPIAVVGCECGDGPEGRRQDVTNFLRFLEETFSMAQARQLANTFRKLWERQSDPSNSFVSLELICHEMQVTICLV